MYKTNLSYAVLQDCLMQLQKLKLLEVHHSKEMYSTTAKGLEFLERWTELQQFIVIGRPVETTSVYPAYLEVKYQL